MRRRKRNCAAPQKQARSAEAKEQLESKSGARHARVVNWHVFGDSLTIQQMNTPLIQILGLAHIGIRVHNLERSVRFYELLGFTKTAGPIGPEPVAILDHPSGLEVNLVLNAPNASEPNVLMDLPERHPGITHFALLCPDIIAA
jgi:hypothetical protein